MSRFDEDDYDEEDLFPDVNDDEDYDEEEINIEYIKVLEKRELIKALKVQLAQKELNYSILNKTISYCKKSWFWNFKSSKTKLNLIVTTYQTFKALVDIDLMDDEQMKEEE